MARRRMISNAVTDAYRFQSMEPQTQLLYVYLCLKADDDGFVGNPYLFTHLTGCGATIRRFTRRSWRSCGLRTSAMSALPSRNRSGTKTEPKRNRSIV